MKYLTDRTEIARAINFAKYPVLMLNRENGDNDYSEGDRVRVAYESSRYGTMFTNGNLYYENGKYKISGEGSTLKDGFGYSDVIRMAQEAKTAIVHPEETIVLIEDYPSKKQCTVKMMKVGKRVDPYCMTVVELNEIE